MRNTKFINSDDIIPESFDTIYLSKLLCVSRSKIYSLMINNKLPYYKLNRKIIIFKQNFIEWIESRPITTFSELKIIKDIPDFFDPNVLQSTLNISKSKIYEIIKEHNLNGFIPGRKIVLLKEDLIKMFLKCSYY